MLRIVLLALVSSSMLSLPIQSIEKKVKIVPEHLSLNASIKASSFHITEIGNYEFTIEIGVGYPPQLFKLGLNMNNDFTMISGENCNCHKSENRYSQYKSKNSYMYNEKISFTSSSNYFEGFWVRDDFLIGNRYINNTNFVLIKKDNISDIVKADGYIGLGFKTSAYTTLFENLISKNLIFQQIYSIYINNPNIIKKQSELTIGYWDPEEFGNGTPIKKINASYDRSYWMGYSHYKSIADLFSLNNTYFTFDINSQYLKIGYYFYYNFFLPRIPQNAMCKFYYSTDNQKLMMCKCISEFPTLVYEVHFNDTIHYNISIKPQSYLMHEKNGYCTLLIIPNKHSYNDIFGLPFFRSYYSMFDIVNKIIYVQEAIEYEYNDENLTFVYQSGISIFVVITLSFGVLYVRKTEENLENNYQRIL